MKRGVAMRPAPQIAKSHRARRVSLGVMLAMCIAAGVTAQEPKKTETPKTEQEKQKPEKKKEKEKPVDETGAAAEALKKLLGPKTKEVSKDPDPSVMPPSRQPEVQGAQDPQKAGQDPKKTEKPKQDPEKPKQDPEKPVDETGAAARALQGLMPGAVPVEKPPGEEMPRDPATISSLSGASADDLPPVGAQTGVPFDGSFTVRYRGRWAKVRDSDQDLIGILGFDVGDAEAHGVTGHFLGRAQWDLDGIQPVNTFNGITETFDRDLTGWVYDAYADVHLIDGIRTLRIGRQSIYDTPVLSLFDGIRVETEAIAPGNTWVGGYVGIPAYIFGPSSRSDDFAIGASVGSSPWEGGRMRFDYMHVQNPATLGVGLKQDDLLGFAIWQNVGESTELYGAYTWLEGASRDLRLRWNSNFAEADFQIQAMYYELFEPQFDFAIEFDPYSSSAGPYQPYRQGTAFLSKGLGDHVTLTGGLDIRRLVDIGQEGKFNRDYERYYLTGVFHDLADDVLSIDITGSWWDTGTENVATVDGALRAQFTPQLSAVLGSGYWLYKVDEIRFTERTNVQAYFLGANYRFGKSLRLAVDYSFEDDELDQYHVFDTTLTWFF